MRSPTGKVGGGEGKSGKGGFWDGDRASKSNIGPAESAHRGQSAANAFERIRKQDVTADVGSSEPWWSTVRGC